MSTRVDPQESHPNHVLQTWLLPPQALARVSHALRCQGELLLPARLAQPQGVLDAPQRASRAWKETRKLVDGKKRGQRNARNGKRKEEKG